MKKTQNEANLTSDSALDKVFLFDMDGTLTPARGVIENFVTKKIRELSSHFKLGIVSGSDFEYIMHQCGPLFDIGGVPVNCIDILPCNGTKMYQWNNTSFELEHSVDMVEEIGENQYKKILIKLFDFQSQIPRFYPDVSFTGTFFQYRGSLLNWCPIGRLANEDQRSAWEKWDKDFGIRDAYVEELQAYITEYSIPVTVALGGATSFDIYPIGWNKTYALQYYPNREVYFIGDRCRVGGNDYHIFEKLKVGGTAWETTCPKETVRIINEILEEL